jgi:hypothetical protein
MGYDKAGGARRQYEKEKEVITGLSNRNISDSTY